MTVLNRSPENVQQTRRTLHDINAYLQVAETKSKANVKGSDGQASR